MKNKPLHITLLLAAIGSVALTGNAKTINSLTAGTLADKGISPEETVLTVRGGTMNAADFSYILDNLNELRTLDISGVTIVAYNGDALPYTGMSSSPAGTLPDYGLTGLKNLQNLILPAKLTAIGRGALSGTGIISLNVPASVKTIGAYAAMRCENLESLSIPASVTQIGTRAFAYCPKLYSVSLTANLTEIPEGLFEACGGLKGIDLSSLANCQEIGPWAFAECNGTTTLVLPPGIQSIEKGAAYGVNKVESLILPHDVAYIGDNAMSAMSAMSVLNVSDLGTVPELGQNVWSNISQPNVTLVVPDDMTGDFAAADQWKDFKIISLQDWQASTLTIGSTIGSKELTVRFEGSEMIVSAGNHKLGRVSVFNAAGSRIATLEADETARFNTSSWVHGVYMIVCNEGAAKITV